jgi:outer membrane cobalamin receptor
VASPRLWLTLDLPPLASLYAGLGRSYRQPTFNELYWPADQWTRGNPRLEPEWSTNLDLGASARPMRFLDCGAGLFHNRLSNLIQWQSDSNYVYQPVNVERATITGAEFEFTLHTGHARVRPGMTWLLARSDSTDLIYRPRLSFTVEHSVEWHWARLSWDVRYTGSRLADPASGQTLPSHLTLDTELALTPRLGPVLATIRTGCRNLFDRRYQVVLDYPVPGRNLYAELGLTI